MTRIAGSGKTYDLSLLDAAGNPKGRTVKLPSVTTILKALPKGGLEWWGYKLGIEATLLLNKDIKDRPITVAEVYELAKKRGREEGDVPTPSNALTKAGTRGTDVHDLAEAVFTLGLGALPPVDEVHPDQVGYIEALVKFYRELEREWTWEPIAIEVPLFSLKHGYAGTVDLILKLQPKGTKGGELYLVADFKTSKGIYESHLLQLPAYTEAAFEQGYLPWSASVWQWVIRFGEDGNYETKESVHTIQDFLCVKRVWELLERKGG